MCNIHWICNFSDVRIPHNLPCYESMCRIKINESDRAHAICLVLFWKLFQNSRRLDCFVHFTSQLLYGYISDWKMNTFRSWSISPCKISLQIAINFLNYARNNDGQSCNPFIFPLNVVFPCQNVVPVVSIQQFLGIQSRCCDKPTLEK